MIGRITSCPAVNENGVPYHLLLERERRLHAEELERFRGALNSWVLADSRPRQNKNKPALLEKARALTARLLAAR